MNKKITIKRGFLIEILLVVLVTGFVIGNWITNSIVSDTIDNCNDAIIKNEQLKYYISETTEKEYK